MPAWQERTEILVGKDGLARLADSRVVVAGAGGVGGYAAEMLVRAGVGHLLIIDNDCVSESNINRQLLALHSTVGRPKVGVLKERLLDINPELDLRVKAEYLTEGNVKNLLEDGMWQDAPNCVIDAIDTLSPKTALIQYCLSAGIPLVSAMGAGAKTDMTAIRIADISKTSECPLAHMLRKRLHKLGIRSGFTAVYSTEKPRDWAVVQEEGRNKKSQVGTISYLPAAFGLACAQACMEKLIIFAPDYGK